MVGFVPSDSSTRFPFLNVVSIQPLICVMNSRIIIVIIVIIVTICQTICHHLENRVI